MINLMLRRQPASYIQNNSSIELIDSAVAEVNTGLVSLGNVATLKRSKESVERNTDIETVCGSDIEVECPANDP